MTKKAGLQNTIDVFSLWSNYKKNKAHDAKNSLIIHYIWLVKYVLQSMSLPKNSILTDEDFFNIGILGLHESIERFESDRGVKFESYAIPRIRGIIQDELRKMDWLSRTARKKAHDLLQVTDELRNIKGREVTSEEIIKKLDITPEEYNSYLAAAAAARSSLSMSEIHKLHANKEDDIDYLDEISDPDEENILTKIENSERLNYITVFLKKLTERKRLVMTLYYYENLTFKEIGNVINVSESRVCQIHSQVVSDLRVKLISLGHI